MSCLSRSLFFGAVACLLLGHAAPAQAAREKVLYSFCSQQNCADGLWPIGGGLITVNGTLYGTTEFGGTGKACKGGCGVVFALDPKTGTETVLHSFAGGTDGAYPQSGLLDVDGTLYGTTSGGGGGNGACTGGCGTAFALDPQTGVETVIYSFCSEENCTDGLGPYSPLIDWNGTLYGTTVAGGTDGGGGTVFALDPMTGTETVLHSFPDGARPEAGLIVVNDMFYGTTYYGGDGFECQDNYFGCGTVFALDPQTGTETVLYSFGTQPNAADGAYAQAGLSSKNGILYGTTNGGGSTHGACCGTVFALDPLTRVETVLHDFTGVADGYQPRSGVIGMHGALYGTTENGGGGGHACQNEGCGTVFTINPKTGTKTVVYSFAHGKRGKHPLNLFAVKGTLYGTTLNGGAYKGGTVFSLTP